MPLINCCSKNDTVLTQPEKEISNEYEISVEEAIKTLSAFLESENMRTKASALNRGEYTVTKWGGRTNTKAKMNPPLYCIDFKGDSGSAILADVKWKCNIHTYNTSGTVGGVEACIRQFGFRNVHHDFAHFGGDRHDLNHLDKVIEMIKNGKPVVMLAFCAEGWPWDWNGHAYVIDGYKSDDTGRYFHINWGWKGRQDGYYAVGCFNERSRTGIEEGIDSGEKDTAPSNYDLFHYYVHYEL